MPYHAWHDGEIKFQRRSHQLKRIYFRRWLLLIDMHDNQLLAYIHQVFLAHLRMR